MCRFCNGSKVDVLYNGLVIHVGPCKFCQDDDDHWASLDGPGWGDPAEMGSLL